MGKYVEFLEYPDGTTVAIEYQGSVLAHIQQQHQQLEQQNKLNLSQKMPRRCAQKTTIKERNLNPMLDLEISI
jgi:hypothetical protein